MDGLSLISSLSARLDPCVSSGRTLASHPRSKPDPAERLIIQFEKIGHLGKPAGLDEMNVVRVLVVALIVRSGRELHRKTEVEVVLLARLSQRFKILDGWDGGESAGGLEKVLFGC